MSNLKNPINNNNIINQLLTMASQNIANNALRLIQNPFYINNNNNDLNSLVPLNNLNLNPFHFNSDQISSFHINKGKNIYNIKKNHKIRTQSKQSKLNKNFSRIKSEKEDIFLKTRKEKVFKPSLNSRLNIKKIKT